MADDMGSGRVLVVGRIKLTPPLEKREQILSMTSSRFRNHVLLFLAAQEPVLGDKPYVVVDKHDMIKVPFGELVFVACPRRSFSVVQGQIYMKYDTPPFDKALLPQGVRVEVHPEDRAVYIGTIEYRRDEFFKIIGIGVEDEFREAEAAYRSLFGAEVPLRKSLAALTVR